MEATPRDVVEALTAQWTLLVAAVDGLDLDAPTRVDGWRNRELVAHLTVQPFLLTRFLAGPEPAQATMTLADNLTGTAGLSAAVDAATRSAAADGRLDLAAAVAGALGPLRAADPARTIVTVQGAIPLADFTVTRVVEAVVHGLDMDPPVTPDPAALQIAAAALRALLPVGVDAPADDRIWVETATGRTPPTPGLAAYLPVLR